MQNYFVLSAGVLLFLLAIYLLWKDLTMRREGVRTIGLVIDVERKNDGEGPVYHPLVQFVTNDGQHITWRCTTATSYWKNLRGKTMSIIYDPRNPQSVIRNHWTNYLPVVFLCLMGAVFFAIFLGVMPVSKS